MKHIIRAVLSLCILLVIGFSFFISTSKGHKVLYEKPFLSAISDFAICEGGIYTLDDTYHTISKYDLDGNFVFAITYPSMGAGRIFIMNGNLCRYDRRENKVYLYDNNGEVSEKINKTYEELLTEGVLNKNPPRKIEHNGIIYELKKRLIFNSEITFESTIIIVESVGYHLMVAAIVLLIIFLFVFAVYNIVKFCINNWLEDKEQKRKQEV